MFGTVHHPDRPTGSAVRDFEQIARRLYRSEKADDAVTRLRDDVDDGTLPRSFERTMPNPGTTALLGELLSVHALELDRRGQPTGTVRIVKWDRGKGPAMLWSPRLSAVISYPGLDVPPPVDELGDADEDAAEAYRTWTLGREPAGKGPMQQPAPPMDLYGLAICTQYASDKFSDRGRQWVRPFLHHHDRGVLLWISKQPPRSRSITAIMVRGGQLRVTEDGLAG